MLDLSPPLHQKTCGSNVFRQASRRRAAAHECLSDVGHILVCDALNVALLRAMQGDAHVEGPEHGHLVCVVKRRALEDHPRIVQSLFCCFDDLPLLRVREAVQGASVQQFAEAVDRPARCIICLDNC